MDYNYAYIAIINGHIINFSNGVQIKKVDDNKYSISSKDKKEVVDTEGMRKALLEMCKHKRGE